MRFDRITIILAALVVSGGGALGYHFLTPGRAAAISQEADDEPVPLPEWTEADCLLYADPGDPKKPSAVVGVYRDEMIGEEQEGKDFVEHCPALASAAKDPATADQIRYQIARWYDVLGREEEFFTVLEGLAPRYPAAAYLLGQRLREKPGMEVASAQFEHAMALLKSALDGGDQRALRPLREMAEELYPLHRFNLPTLVAALQSGRTELIPDTAATRMAAYSIWDGYRQRCKAWEILPVAPMDQAAIDNYLLPVQAERIVNAINQLPTMVSTTRDWFNNIGNISFLQVLRDFNTAKAYPGQLLFTIDTAANRDGSQLYDQFTCSGPRGSQFQTNAIKFFNDRKDLTPSQSSVGDMEYLAKRPDVLALI